MCIRCLSSYVSECIGYKKLRRIVNIGVACESRLEGAGHSWHGLILPLPGGIFN